MQLGPDQPHPVAPHDLHQLPLALDALAPHFAEPGTDHHQRPDPLPAAFLGHGGHELLGDGDHREVDLVGNVQDTGVRLDGVDGGGLRD